VGLKYRHFDLGNATFSVFPGSTSLVSERGDMVTGTLSYQFPIGAPALVPPMSDPSDVLLHLLTAEVGTKRTSMPLCRHAAMSVYDLKATSPVDL
jgi:hypothetical protein